MRRAFGKARTLIAPEEWPKPQAPTLLGEPTFLFILTPPHSGSTALAQALNSAHAATLLEERGEGQWLIPGMCQEDRWNPDKYIDWESVKAVWFSRLHFIESLVGKRDVVIEKSPPNIVRIEGLTKHFPKHEFIVFNRNPYACCASILYRNHAPRNLPDEKRIEILKDKARLWVFRSEWLKRHIQTYAPIFFTYEQFCRDPKGTLEKVVAAVPELTGINPERLIKVKDYPPQQIIDQNERQIRNLSPADRDAISEVLRPHEKLLQFFGYGVSVS